MTVENLEINVKTNAGDAATQFKSLSKAISGVSSAGKNVASGGTAKAVRDVGKAAQTATKHTGGFLSSLGRIAKYRILRTIIKEITSAFSEGLKNAYAFSQGINGTLASAMDSLATKSLTMKNQLGAALGNLLTALMPIILKIIEFATKAASAISALFSALGGGQYLVAKEVPQTWQDTTDATKAATKAAKDYQRTILGFDEINRLNAPSDSGTSGVSDAAASAADMFELRELPAWAQAIKDFIDGIDFSSIEGFVSSISEKLGELYGKVISIGIEWAKEGWENLKAEYDRRLAEYNGSHVITVISFYTDIELLPAKIAEKIRTWIDENIRMPFREGVEKATGIDLNSRGWEIVRGFVSGMINAFLNMLPGIGVFKMVYEYVVTPIMNALDWINNGGLKKWWFEVKANAHSAWNSVKNFLGNVKEWVMNLFRNIVNGIIERINRLGSINFNGLTILGQQVIPSFSAQIFRIPTFSEGGFPDVGSLFIANERGPELVGNIGGRTAVGTNEDIEAGIEEAAYRGFVRAIAASGNNGGGDIVLNVNGREFARATYKDYQSAARETGGSLITNFA